MTNSYLTDHCGILDKLLPGDIVLADRGFDITESVGMIIPTDSVISNPLSDAGKASYSSIYQRKTPTVSYLVYL